MRVWNGPLAIAITCYKSDFGSMESISHRNVLKREVAYKQTPSQSHHNYQKGSSFNHSLPCDDQSTISVGLARGLHRDYGPIPYHCGIELTLDYVDVSRSLLCGHNSISTVSRFGHLILCCGNTAQTAPDPCLTSHSTDLITIPL